MQFQETSARFGIAFQQCSSDVAFEIVGPGPDQQPIRHCNVTFKMQAYSESLAFLVSTLDGGYDVLLGNPWMTHWQVQPIGGWCSC